MQTKAIRHKPIPSSEFRHIERADTDPVARCALCGGIRLAFYAYYGVPVCFVCQYDLSSEARQDVLQARSIALNIAIHESARAGQAADS